MHTDTRDTNLSSQPRHILDVRNNIFYLNVLQNFTDVGAYFPLSFLTAFWIKIIAHYLGRKTLLKSVFFVFAHELLMKMNGWQIKSPWYLGVKKNAFNYKFKICLHVFRKGVASLYRCIPTLVQSSSLALTSSPLWLICTEKKIKKNEKYWVIWL